MTANDMITPPAANERANVPVARVRRVRESTVLERVK